MPSPLAHLVAAGMMGHHFDQNSSARNDRAKRWFLCLFFTYAPDLDVIPGIITGAFADYHNQQTHSLLFGLVCCLVMAPIFHWILRGPDMKTILLIAFLGYGLHLIMDVMTRGRGLMLLWPFSTTRFALDPPVFVGLRWSEGLVSPHHLKTIVNEVLIGALAISLYAFILKAPRWRLR